MSLREGKYRRQKIQCNQIRANGMVINTDHVERMLPFGRLLTSRFPSEGLSAEAPSFPLSSEMSDSSNPVCFVTTEGFLKCYEQIGLLLHITGSSLA